MMVQTESLANMEGHGSRHLQEHCKHEAVGVVGGHLDGSTLNVTYAA